MRDARQNGGLEEEAHTGGGSLRARARHMQCVAANLHTRAMRTGVLH